MEKKLRKLLSGVISSTMLFGAAAIPQAVSAEGSPIINVTFDEGGDAYTLHGGTLEEGRSKNALSLSGEKQYADINGIADKLAGVDGDFTVSVWCKPDNITVWSRIYDFGNGSSGTYAFLTPSSGNNPRLAVTTNGIAGEQQVNADTSLTANEWHNITVTREGNLSTMYIDGLSVGTTTSFDYKFSEIGKMDNYYLGKSQFDADPYFDGMIDDFCVYDYALEEKEVRVLAAEAFEAKKNQLIYENNCFIMETHFYMNDMEEINSLNTLPVGMSISDKNISDTAASFVLNGAMSLDVSKLTAYAAEYNDKGELCQVVTESFADGEINSDSFEVNIPYTKTSNENNVKLFVWNNMKPLYEGTASLKAVTSIENYTVNSDNLSAQMYAVSSDGKETKLSDSQVVTVDSIEEKEVTMSVSSDAIPGDTEKIIVKVTAEKKNETYTAATLFGGVDLPNPSPLDSEGTTNGAHDPTIFKDPVSGKYYAYSTHNLISESDDLINWTTKSYTDKMPQKTVEFINKNYTSTANTTYWAPDLIYVEEDTEHPYWFYLSVSCGLGGRNSVIGLVKSDSPWLWDGDNIEDCGSVIATKESRDYITNAIDANLYTDVDGSRYFIWGSFWGGIQIAPLTEDGRVEGVDYSSDSKILESTKALKTTIFAAPGGKLGPEGAYMVTNEETGYRYLFVSYGWLGSNYNTRVARAPITKTIKEAIEDGSINTFFVDQNGKQVGTAYDKSTRNTWGYKLIGSYQFSDIDDTYSVSKTNNGDWELTSGAGQTYYANAHNSAFKDDDGEWYFVHHTKTHIDYAGILRVRKMLWTDEGWPVVSPMAYAGEKVQNIPKEMLYGTYDLSSIGVNILPDGVTNINNSRDSDLPVSSSKVTLLEDGTLGDNIGTWSFDGEYTVTINFTESGNEDLSQFYKAGDVLTMFVLTGYDKNEREAVISMTGTNQDNIAQFAKKGFSNIFKTEPEKVSTEAIAIEKSAGGNPELGFDADGNLMYGGDPAAMVDGDTVYLYVGHDISEKDSYVIPEWTCYSSKNMTDWKYEGIVMKAYDISWANDKTSAWASQTVKYGDKYYLYFCTWDKTSEGRQSIGVAVSDSPTGPFKDIGKPLVSGSVTTPETSNYNDIDPTVLIDTDENGEEHRYLAWGNGKYYICELNEDMVSVKDIDNDGEIAMHKDIKERKIKSMGNNVFTEAPWLYKRDGKYYMFFAANWREEMAYAIADTPMGRYDYKQTIMPPTSTSNTNHPSVIDFNGKTYFIYHNGMLPWGSGYRRSVCIQELEFDENGYVYPLTETSIGLTGTASIIKTVDEKFAAHSEFRNSLSDASYPISTNVITSNEEDGYNTAWEIVDGAEVPAGENDDNYVSIQSVNKPGLYITSNGNSVTLTQNADGKIGDKMTFKTVKGLNGDDGTVSFESVSDNGKYLTILNGIMTLSYGTDADASTFTIGKATEKDESVIDVADAEPEPEPAEDIEQNFESLSAGKLISLQTTDTPPYTAINGLTLYIGARAGGADSTTNFEIKSDGGKKVLSLNSGKYVSASRGPRLQINTPPIPNGYTATAQIKVKLKADGTVLRYNDSISNESGTEIMGLTTDWQTLEFSITNSDDLYMRKIKLGDTVIAEDYVDSFPVLWGTVENEKYTSVYFDDLTIKTTNASGEQEKPVILPEPIANYEFEDNVVDSVTGESGNLTASKITEAVSVENASYVDGVTGKAIEFTGENSYGLELPTTLPGRNYTISFDVKLDESTQHSPFVFIANYENGVLKGGDDNAEWISIAPQGWQKELASGPMIWSRDVPGGYLWNDLFKENNNSMTLDEWHNITVTASGTNGSIYVDKKKIASGTIADIIDETTKIFLGVNAWDTPLNGAVDNLLIYDKALTSKQIALIGE